MSNEKIEAEERYRENVTNATDYNPPYFRRDMATMTSQHERDMAVLADAYIAIRDAGRAERSVVVPLTDRERVTLAALSREMEIPPDRVMIQSLRVLQASRSRMPPLAMALDAGCTCDVCGIGYPLPSGRCDH